MSILVAILYLVLGTLRLGFLCNMLSKPIISAFLTAGAIIISTSQVNSLFKLPAPQVLFPIAIFAGPSPEREPLGAFIASREIHAPFDTVSIVTGSDGKSAQVCVVGSESCYSCR